MRTRHSATTDRRWRDLGTFSHSRRRQPQLNISMCRFWNRGYWKNHLGTRSYHISALYLVDLMRFRRLAAGDRLRGQYQALSQDPNSLANLDQVGTSREHVPWSRLAPPSLAGPAQQHDPHGAHQVSASGVAVV